LSASDVDVGIMYNVLGQKVTTLFDDVAEAGIYRAV
jgi:hypothetical protein